MNSARKRKKAHPSANCKRQNSASDTPPDLESHCQVIRNAVEEARKGLQVSLREQLRKMRQDMEWNEEPQHLFPIWENIVKNLENAIDLANCAHAHHLLKYIINIPDQDLLFGKVLPLLIPYLKERSRVPVMKCYGENSLLDAIVDLGKVCKKWRAGVDLLADSFFRVDKLVSGTVQRLEEEPKRHIGNDKDLVTHRYSLTGRDDLEYVLENPVLSDVEFEVSEKLFRVSYLNKCGHLCGQLTLTLTTERSEKMSSKQLFAFSVKAIEKCANLRSFCLTHFNCLSSNGIDERLDLTAPKSLECLQVRWVTEDISPVQDGLLKHLSSQLKRIQLEYWNSELYHTMTWNSLTELEIEKGVTAKILDSLANMTAPKLHKLSLVLFFKCRDLQMLFQTINQFPNLRHLSLVLSEGFEAFSESEIVNVPVDMLTVNRVTTLKLISKHLKTFLLIPVLFPAVKNLIMSYGDWGPDQDRNFDQNPSNQVQFIQTYKNMYKSNIWTVLPRLDFLKVNFRYTINMFNPAHTQRRLQSSKLFTRWGYVLETAEYSAGYQRHLNKIRDVLRNEIKQKLAEGRENLSWKLPNDEDYSSDSESESTKSSDSNFLRLYNQADAEKADINFEKIFCCVIPWLRKSGVLVCRLVCKSWQKLVDKQQLEILKPYMLDKFHLPLDTNARRQKFYSFVKRNSKELFFAYNSEILLKDLNPSEGITLLLKEVAKNIRHLTISVKPGVSSCIVDVFHIVQESTSQCHNMKSLSLQLNTISKGDYIKYRDLRRKRNVQTPMTLESLSISIPKQYWCAEENEGTELNLLLSNISKACEHSLKILRLDKPLKARHPELRELIIKHMRNPETLCASPNLEKLRVCFVMREVEFKDLWKLTNKYPKLERLEVQFSSAYLGSATSIIYSDPAHTINVTTLKIVVIDKYLFSLDFLAHFPFVKVFCLTYGKYAPLMSEGNESGEDTQQISENNFSIPGQGIHPREPENDYIQLARYLKDEKPQEHDSERIYASSIWTTLQRLEKIEIVFWDEEQNMESAVFRRKYT